MINALLGGSFLPARAKPSSSQLVRCHHSETRKVIVYFEDDNLKQFDGSLVSQELVSTFADESINSNNKEGVREIELCSPDFPFGDDILLIDSPGLDAFGYDGHEKLTMASLLPTVDMCLLITTCKSNSDLKLLEVLNAINETGATGMPVILVQNMIDSIQPSPDGTKSRDDVAKDHMRRLERIVNSSSFEDKSAISIVQFSAINAVQGRIESDKELLKASNYDCLVERIQSTIDSIIPVINSSRLQNVKKELVRISEEANKDAGLEKGSLVDASGFQYSTIIDEVDEFISEKESGNQALLNDVDAILDEIPLIDCFSQDTLDEYITRTHSIEQSILNVITETKSFIDEKCTLLNLNPRDISSASLKQHNQSPTLHQKTTEFKVEKKGFWAGVKRFFGSSSGYKTITEVVTDNQATKKDLIEYVESCKKVFKIALNDWDSKVKSAKQEIKSQVNLRKKQFEERRSHALESQSYLEISRNISKLVDAIILPETFSRIDADNRISKPADNLSEIEVDKSDYALYSLSTKVKQQIQKEIIRRLVESPKKVLVIGSDEVSEQFFVSQLLPGTKNIETIHSGINYLSDDAVLCHGYSLPASICISDYPVVFILINGTQVGAAEKPLYSLTSQACIRKDSAVFWVVQDFQEIINAKEAYGLIQELISFERTYFPEKRIKILLSHQNPIYNLAIAALQEKKKRLHTDNVEILDELKSLHYLHDEASKDIIHDIIKAFN